MKTKTERIQFLVNVTIVYNNDKSGLFRYTRAEAIADAKRDLLDANTNGNKSTSARLAKFSKK